MLMRWKKWEFPRNSNSKFSRLFARDLRIRTNLVASEALETAAAVMVLRNLM